MVAILSGLLGRDVAPDEPLMDAGLDSLSGVELKQQLESEFGVELPETVVFDYPTAAALSTFILERNREGGEGDGDESDALASSDSEAFADRPRRSRRRRRRERRSSRGAEEAAAATLGRVLAIIGGLLGRDVAPDEPLMDAGLDSLSGVELKQQMESEFAVELPETVVFDYPTPAALASFVAERRAGAGGGDEEYASSEARSSSSDASEAYRAPTRRRRRRRQRRRASEDGSEGAKASAASIQTRVVAILGDLLGRAVEPDEPLMDAGLDSLSASSSNSSSSPSSAWNYRRRWCLITRRRRRCRRSSRTRAAPGGDDECDEDSYSSSDAYSSSYASDAVVSANRRRHLTTRRAAAAARPAVVVSGASFDLPTVPGVGRVSSAFAVGDVIAHVPRERWDMHRFWDEYLDAEAGSGVVPPHGGFVASPEAFDATLFAASRAEACVMDAQHRSLLEGVLHARACTSLATRGADDVDGGSKCGVYVGISGTDFLVDHVKPAATELNAFILPGNVLSVAAGRVSFVFGFRGPSLAVDTACSSSIVSTHAATEAIASGGRRRRRVVRRRRRHERPRLGAL